MGLTTDYLGNVAISVASLFYLKSHRAKLEKEKKQQAKEAGMIRSEVTPAEVSVKMRKLASHVLLFILKIS